MIPLDIVSSGFDMVSKGRPVVIFSEGLSWNVHFSYHEVIALYYRFKNHCNPSNQLCKWLWIVENDWFWHSCNPELFKKVNEKQKQTYHMIVFLSRTGTLAYLGEATCCFSGKRMYGTSISNIWHTRSFTCMCCKWNKTSTFNLCQQALLGKKKRGGIGGIESLQQWHRNLNICIEKVNAKCWLVEIKLVRDVVTWSCLWKQKWN